MKKIELLLPFLLVLLSSNLHRPAFASEFENSNLSSGFGTSSFFEVGTSSAALGVYASSDAATVDTVEFSGEAQHLVIGDLSFMTAFFFGRQGMGSNEDVAFYQLRLEGSVSAGLQAWRVVPLTLSVEDLTIAKTPDSTRTTSLLGSTVYLPIHLSNQDHVLFVALTAGARLNTELENTAFAIQSKVRFLSDRVTAELRYLMSLSSADAEKKFAASASLRDLFRAGDEIGISFFQTWTGTQTKALERGPAIIVHYGLSY